ncbi:hypothetical protein RV14_GL000006 [Enterococcus ratti]|uniref:Uncharacterized protein n=1 Tax=Enterococcus ratti TaxID=150033 RepID=A0A1L8WS44_9ENTE|nr:hypothetical protein RV14_GL000006 [Enterococcus ratti]
MQKGKSNLMNKEITDNKNQKFINKGLIFLLNRKKSFVFIYCFDCEKEGSTL